MKHIIMVLLMIVVGTLTSFAQPTLIYQGNNSFTECRIPFDESPDLQEEMVKLIKQGFLPIVVERSQSIAWLYLHDIENPRDYENPDSLKSEYLELIPDLFPIKMNRRLKSQLENGGIKSFLKTLGIEYAVIGEEVVSKINYDKFEQFVD